MNYLELLSELADKLQGSEFGTEYTLDLKSGTIEESDDLSIESYLYANPSPNGWFTDYSYHPAYENMHVSDTLYEPANYMSLGTMRHHLGDLEDDLSDYSKLIASLSAVDTYECSECNDLDDYSDFEGCEEDHLFGWAVVSALVP